MNNIYKISWLRAIVAAEEADLHARRLAQMQMLRCEDKFTLREIAEVFDVSTSHVYNLLKEDGKQK